MNASRFKIHGMTDEPGHCELCGTYCPRRRVAVELIDADGSTTGDVQLWGVVCAAEARHGRRDSTLARMLRDEAEQAGTYTGAVPARRRPARGAAPRRQTRKEAARLAARAFAESQAVWLRTDAQVPASLNATLNHAAAYRYQQTRRPKAGAYFVADAAGRVAVVDGTDAADVELFARHGFSRSEFGAWSDWYADPAAA
jgi:hypothetical protein